MRQISSSRRLGGHAVELLLEPLELAGDAGAAEQRQAAQAAEPLPEAALVLTGHWDSAAGGGGRVGAQLGPRDDRVEVAEAEVRLGEAEVVGELLARRSAGRRAGR